jgi:hypothetical protein
MLRIAALLVTIALSAGTGPSRQQTTPLIRGSGTNAIVVDVIVRDSKGNPVTDLRKEDFVLLEDGAAQEIGDATRVGNPVYVAKSGGAPPPAPGTATNDGHTFPSFTAIIFNRLSPEARGRAYQADGPGVTRQGAHVLPRRGRWTRHGAAGGAGGPARRSDCRPVPDCAQRRRRVGPLSLTSRRSPSSDCLQAATRFGSR